MLRPFEASTVESAVGAADALALGSTVEVGANVVSVGELGRDLEVASVDGMLLGADVGDAGDDCGPMLVVCIAPVMTTVVSIFASGKSQLSIENRTSK